MVERQPMVRPVHGTGGVCTCAVETGVQHDAALAIVPTASFGGKDPT